jgi:hypothetical protein
MPHDAPDVRDGLTRDERIVLYVLRELQEEQPGRPVRLATLYGRVLAHADLSRAQLTAIVERLSSQRMPLIYRSQQNAFRG